MKATLSLGGLGRLLSACFPVPRAAKRERYLCPSEATAATFQDGWLRTGDRVERDDNGVLAVRGRLKDVIVTADGVNVDPGAVEKELESEPGVREAAVVARRGPSGETVHAELVLDADVSLQDAVAAANGRLPAGESAC